MRRSSLAAALLCLAASLLLAACGSGSSSSISSTEVSTEVAKAVATAGKLRAAEEARAPKGASSTLRGIYATFPPPSPNPQDKRSGPAIHGGIVACAGKSPSEVKEEFYAAARSNLSSEQAKTINRIARFEGHSSTDISFTAGQLAADIYEATLPEGIGQYGYQGCVYALAQGLEKELAPGR